MHETSWKKRRGNRASENLRQSESVQTSYPNLWLKRNCEPNALQPGYFTLLAVVQLYRRGREMASLQKELWSQQVPLHRGGFASACRPCKGMSPTGQGSPNVRGQSPKCRSYEGPANFRNFCFISEATTSSGC